LGQPWSHWRVVSK